MYQDSSGVDNAEYHQIMYNYENIKLPHEAASSLKMTNVVADGPALSGSDSLTTVKLSAGEALVPSSVNTPLAVTNVLTTTSFSEGVRLAAPSLSVATTPLPCASITDGIPLTAVSFSPTNSQPVEASVIPNGHFSDNSIPSTLNVATMSEPESASVHTREDSMEIGQIVHTSEDGVLDGNLVSSSSIDAVVTSMVASADCPGVVSNGRKIPSQVLAKLLSDESLSLDMVRIYTEHDVEGAHQSQGFNVLTRPGMLVHTKIADNDIINGSSLNQYRQVEVVNLRPSIRPDNEESTHCSVLWTCAYCSMAFPNSEAVRQHQENECTENQEIALATTTPTPAVVESLISPVRQVNGQSYEMNLVKESQIIKDHDFSEIIEKEGEQQDSDYENFLSCTVCGSEFTLSDELGKHHLTHSLQELSSALLKMVKPQKRKKVEKTLPSSLPTANPPSAVLSQQNESENPGGGGGSDMRIKTEVSHIKDEIADNPGDTPPQSPLQESTTQKIKKDKGAKVNRSGKSDKKKSEKRASKETKLPRQRKSKGRVVGQGSREPHICPICNKVLSCRGNLSKHLITHKSEKPFKCTVCDLGFNAKRDQQYHYLQYHTNKRPYNCVVCGKGYVFRHYLLKHMVFHSEERKFSCEICGKQFLTAKCVGRHKKRHKKEKLFKCTSCLKSFTVNADLKAHIRKIHRNSKKSGAGKQQVDLQPKVSQTMQTLQHKNQAGDGHLVKSKDITEFLIPRGAAIPAHLLPTDLEPAALSGSVSSKEEMLITADQIGSIIPLSRISATGYSASVAPIGDHTTYVMINSSEEEVNPQNVSTAHGLNIMYTTAAGPAQEINELGQTQLDQSELGPSQHMLVGSSLGDAAEQLTEGKLHQHIESQTELQHQAQPTHALATVTESSLGEHQRNMNITVSSGESGVELAASGHDHSIVHSSHDAGNGFHLELLSQTIQLELQRTQSSSANYLGISDR